jgi:hypothetical protein
MMIRYVTHEIHNHECGYTAASSPGTYDVLVDMAIVCSFRAAHSPPIETITAIIIEIYYSLDFEHQYQMNNDLHHYDRPATTYGRETCPQNGHESTCHHSYIHA